MHVEADAPQTGGALVGALRNRANFVGRGPRVVFVLLVPGFVSCAVLEIGLRAHQIARLKQGRSTLHHDAGIKNPIFDSSKAMKRFGVDWLRVKQKGVLALARMEDVTQIGLRTRRGSRIHTMKAQHASSLSLRQSLLFEVCGKACSSLSRLTVHMRTHTGLRPYPDACVFEDCRNTFSTSRQLSTGIHKHAHASSSFRVKFSPCFPTQLAPGLELHHLSPIPL